MFSFLLLLFVFSQALPSSDWAAAVWKELWDAGSFQPKVESALMLIRQGGYAAILFSPLRLYCVINLCRLLSPLSITDIVPLWLALCQRVIFTWMDTEASGILCIWLNICLRVWMYSMHVTRLHYNITFYLLPQGPPGPTGPPGEKVCFLGEILSMKFCTLCFHTQCVEPMTQH